MTPGAPARKFALTALVVGCAFQTALSVSDAAALVLAPPPGKLYQGFFYSAVSPETDDANEDLFVLHDRALSAVFRNDLQKHRDRIQETPLVQSKH